MFFPRERFQLGRSISRKALNSILLSAVWNVSKVPRLTRRVSCCKPKLDGPNLMVGTELASAYTPRKRAKAHHPSGLGTFGLRRGMGFEWIGGE